MIIEEWRPIAEAPQTGEDIAVVARMRSHWRYYQRTAYRDGQWVANESQMAGYLRELVIQPDYWVIRQLPSLG